MPMLPIAGHLHVVGCFRFHILARRGEMSFWSNSICWSRRRPLRYSYNFDRFDRSRRRSYRRSPPLPSLARLLLEVAAQSIYFIYPAGARGGVGTLPVTLTAICVHTFAHRADRCAQGDIAGSAGSSMCSAGAREKEQSARARRGHYCLAMG